MTEAYSLHPQSQNGETMKLRRGEKVLLTGDAALKGEGYR